MLFDSNKTRNGSQNKNVFFKICFRCSLNDSIRSENFPDCLVFFKLNVNIRCWDRWWNLIQLSLWHAHENKQIEDTWWWVWVVDWQRNFHAVANEGHPNLNDLKLVSINLQYQQLILCSSIYSKLATFWLVPQSG